MTDHDDIAVFEEARPRLLGLAYRIMGSRADAEDAVQDTFVKWSTAQRSEIANPAAWLMTSCTRRCIDLLRAAHRSRVDYVGTWLPEPMHMLTADPAEEALGSSLTTAFLLMLERLTPKERAAYLLHEIFDIDYPDIARALDMNQAACRQLVSRARGHVDDARVRHVTPPARQEALLAAFESAIAGGDTGTLAAMLSDDIALSADGGGKVAAAARVLHGKAKVMGFFDLVLRRFWSQYRLEAVDINGGRGFVVRNGDQVEATVSFGYDQAGRANAIYIMRNPDKLARLDAASIR
ncbi:MAG: RNA polymerase sigma factor SigJ [Reyranellaceae bacterium]